jgi:hypothetical protein
MFASGMPIGAAILFLTSGLAIISGVADAWWPMRTSRIGSLMVGDPLPANGFCCRASYKKDCSSCTPCTRSPNCVKGAVVTGHCNLDSTCADRAAACEQNLPYYCLNPNRSIAFAVDKCTLTGDSSPCDPNDPQKMTCSYDTVINGAMITVTVCNVGDGICPWSGVLCN